MYHVNVHVSLMEENVTWMKSGIPINAGVSSKIQENIVCVKKIVLEILLHAIAKMMNIWQV